MSEPGDELTPLPETPEDRPKLSRSPYIALGVAALVVSTVFATVAALASTRDEAAPAPRSVDTVETTTPDTYTTDPVATSVPGKPVKKPAKKPSTTATTTSGDETTTEDETTTGGGNTTTPGRTTTHRPPNTSTPPPNQAPSATFTSSCSNLECDFDGGDSADPDGSIASYSWSFGGSGETIHHAFDAAGTYHVTLTVTDDKGKTATFTRDVTVTTPTTTSGN